MRGSSGESAECRALSGESICLYLFVQLYLSVYLCLFLYMTTFLSVSTFLSASTFLSTFLSTSVLWLFFSVCLYLSVYLCLCLCLYLMKGHTERTFSSNLTFCLEKDPALRSNRSPYLRVQLFCDFRFLAKQAGGYDRKTEASQLGPAMWASRGPQGQGHPNRLSTPGPYFLFRFFF